MNTASITKFLLAIGLLCSAAANAGNYGVSPLDVQFTTQQKSTVLTVTSDDSKPISLRLRAMRWTQNDKGEDIYEESPDLIFFPKRLELKPGDKKIVRVGINETPSGEERAYRLFLEELAPPTAPGDGQTKLSVLINIGIPVFVSSADAVAVLKTEKASVTKAGNLNIQLANKGTSRARISRISLNDGTLVSESIPSRYLFPGISKSFEIKVPTALCNGKENQIRIEAEKSNTEVAVAFPNGCKT